MASFLLRPEAVCDLEEIWNYTIRAWDAEQAESYLRLLNRGFEKLVNDPELGSSCDWLREGYRKLLVGRHVVFFRLRGEDIDIVRVLHQSMDFDRHL